MFMLRLCLCCCLLALPLHSQPLSPSENLFTQYERARAGLSSEPLKCGFPMLAALRVASPQNTQEQQLLKLASARPVLPKSYFTTDNRFRIHYATSGEDAVSPVSTNPDGVPDFVYEAAKAAQHAYALLVDTLGMKAHAPDNGVDGAEFDFYIIDLGNLYGETRFDFSTGTGPAYTVIDNDYGPAFYSQGLDGLRVTVAHEFFHAVQLNYFLRGDDVFFFEISSTWFEDFAYDEVNDYFAYLRRWFRETALPLNTKNGSHEYGSALWLHYLTKRLQSPAVVRVLWERIVQEPALLALKDVLQASPYSLPFNQAVQEFYAWCFFTNYRADSEKYFEEGEDYPSAQFVFTRAASQHESVPDDVEPLAAKYYRFIRTAQDLQATLQIPVDPGRFGLTAIAVDENEDYTLRTAYGTAPAYLAGQARQDTVAIIVGNGGVPSTGGSGSNDFNLQISLGTQSELEDVLGAPFPNPFRPVRDGLLRIPYRINSSTIVESVIFAEDGRVVWNSKSKQRLAVGPYEIVWNGRDNSGQLVPSGVYVLRLLAGDFVASVKFVVINK